MTDALARHEAWEEGLVLRALPGRTPDIARLTGLRQQKIRECLERLRLGGKAREEGGLWHRIARYG